jgi:zinc/manganese transport system substrate-binding protein
MRKITFLLALFTIWMGACSPAAQAPASSSSPRVLAAETFLGDMAQNVAGNRIQVETLLKPTVDPHTFEPTPQDAVKITESRLLIVNGLGYETWLAKTLDNISGKRIVVTATTGLMPNADPSGEHPGGDPHMWMNPLEAIHYVENIRDGLIQLDPAGREVYMANADAYIAQLRDLDQWVKDQVAPLPVQKRLLVTNHDALGYFAQAYDFKIVGAVIPSVTDEASPSARQMASLIDTIKSTGAPAIFLDIGENQNLARQIASESGAKVVTGLYVESTSVPTGPAPTYLDMIKYDVTTIVNALK